MTDPFIYVSAILAGTSVAACVGWHLARANYRWALGHLRRSISQSELFLGRLIDTEHKLRKIERTRHEAAKKGRAAQIAQRKARIAETTRRLRKGIAA